MNNTRTAGDGMESEEPNVKEVKKEIPFCSEIVQVYPSNNIVEKRKSIINTKSVKFVPYEPYAAAVKPITPLATSKRIKISRNNMDINTLITQMSQMNTNLNEFKSQRKQFSVAMKPSNENIKDNSLTTELQGNNTLYELQKLNESLKEQVKQQIQINKELKTMLVASMGEELETQVQSLNEDKKHLTNALVNSTQHLSTHQEQTEWLAGQCEVWRSKFLASSLMVEELASCKRILNDKTEKLQQAIKQLLEERCRTREMMMYTYRNLYSCHEKTLENIVISECMDPNTLYHRPIGSLNLNVTMPPSTNILDLASANLKLSENFSASVEKQDINHLDSLLTTTEGERYAETVMAMPLEVKNINEVPLNALVHHAYNNTVISSKPVPSCVHCSGKIQLL